MGAQAGQTARASAWVMRLVVNVCRFVVGLTFIFSGFVKAIDPLGTQYKIDDYVAAVGLAGIVPQWVTLLASIGLSALEFCLGIFITFAMQRKVASKLVLAFMTCMTAVTVWLVVANPIEDCGCFGDAIHLTNAQTLLKNVVLLACAAVLAWSPLSMYRFISKTNQWIAINYSMLFILAMSAYSLYDLPMFDFRPYHVGANIKQGMTIPEGAPQPTFETTFTMEKDGERREFTLEDYPDSTWTFVDSQTRQTSEGYVPPIHDFSITTHDGEDITDSVLDRKGYTFLLVSPNVAKADDGNFGDIDQIYEYAQEQGYPFICLTAATDEQIARWQDVTGAEYPFCATDETTLKTIIRSNPGLVLLKDGMVVRKWSHNRLPKTDVVKSVDGDDVLSGRLEQSKLGRVEKDAAATKVASVLLWFFVPLLVLTLSDRLWAWSTWLRRKKFNSKINNKKMAKKIVAGNWKMNKNLQEGVALAKEIMESLAGEQPKCSVVICTPFIHLASVAEVLKGQTVVELGAENCADKDHGAYTGEVSAEMVKSTGAQYVILGHSERRQYYNETPEILKEKVQLALAAGLKVIFCCGETLEEREANKQEEVVKAELEGSVFNLSAEEWKSIILAYEPIWAIGTGKTATSDQAEEMLAYIRAIVAEKYGKEAADETSILYGGSCKASNAPELFSKPDIDGGLIGGASLKAPDFKGIIDAWK